MQGHIRKRGKGSWTVVVDLGRDPASGKRRQLWRSVAGTKRSRSPSRAAPTPEEHRHRCPTGTHHRRRIPAAVADSLRTPEYSPDNVPRYEQLIRVHLIPTLGNLPLAKLRPLHIQDAYQRILSTGLSDLGPFSSVTGYCGRPFSTLFSGRTFTRNPADAVEAPQPGRYEVPALSPQQVRDIIAAAEETPYGALVHTAVLTGLRLGELLGLRWQDVDLKAGLLQVRQTCQWLPRQGFIFRQPKSYRSARSVALLNVTVAVLRQHRIRQIEHRLTCGLTHQEDVLVFAPAPLAGRCTRPR